MAEREVQNEQFYVLQYSQNKKGNLELRAYPILDQKRNRGAQMQIKTIWPEITGGQLNASCTVQFLYSPMAPWGMLEFKLDDILRLRDKAQEPLDMLYGKDNLCLNAYLLLGMTRDERLKVSEDPESEGCVVIAVNFFSINV